MQRNLSVKKHIEAPFYEYRVFEGERQLAFIKGRMFNQFIVISLFKYESIEPDIDDLLAKEIQKVFYEDCKKHHSKIILTIGERTEKAQWFLENSDFQLEHINHVFLNNLKGLRQPNIQFELKPFKEVDLNYFQSIYYECSKGDPQNDSPNLTPEGFFEKHKREIGHVYDESLICLALFQDQVIGVLSLRVEQIGDTDQKEGSINYIGLLPAFRGKGYGKELHLTGLRRLAKLGCNNYYGGTDSKNKPMLKIFDANNCLLIEVQHYYFA